MLTVRQMKIVVAVANAGSINHARKTLKLAQPTISQQLSKMEDVLGVQLFKRGAQKGLALTPAGEFWFKESTEILNKIDLAFNRHKSLFSHKKIELKFGATPSLVGRFHEQAAIIASQIPDFSRFEFVWALSSDQIVDLIQGHQINCAIVSKASVENYSHSLNISELFEDDLVWVVPQKIDREQLIEALKNRSSMLNNCESLYRYVHVGPGVPWMQRVESWYKYNFPNAEPYFSCSTHSSAIDIVAAGLATCFCPMSLLPNLPEYLLDRVQLFSMNEPARSAVFVMPKHLLSISAFVEFKQRINGYVRQNYSENVISNSFENLHKFSEICDN
jgi:DNA-binding transcriptional LysR family regulator